MLCRVPSASCRVSCTECLVASVTCHAPRGRGRVITLSGESAKKSKMEMGTLPPILTFTSILTVSLLHLLFISTVIGKQHNSIRMSLWALCQG